MWQAGWQSQSLLDVSEEKGLWSPCVLMVAISFALCQSTAPDPGSHYMAADSVGVGRFPFLQAEFAARKLVPVGSEREQQIMIHHRINVPKPRSRDAISPGTWGEQNQREYRTWVNYPEGHMVSNRREKERAVLLLIPELPLIQVSLFMQWVIVTIQLQVRLTGGENIGVSAPRPVPF